MSDSHCSSIDEAENELNNKIFADLTKPKLGNRFENPSDSESENVIMIHALKHCEKGNISKMKTNFLEKENLNC
jgi:hypothetical protein